MQIKTDLAQLAAHIMLEKGLQPQFSQEELLQLSRINGPDKASSQHNDLSSLLWCSIDNDDSRDLDQLTYAEKGMNGDMTLWVAVADVDALVKKDTPIDKYAQINTTSVYTPAKIFPMLPEKLSTNLTSLNEDQERTALVVNIQMTTAGKITNASIFQALVKNHAKLAYPAIGDWLEGKAPPPEKVKEMPALEKTLKVQHEAAQILKRKRHQEGALTLESSKTEFKILQDEEISVPSSSHNLARQLIEEFMVAANQVVAGHFQKARIPSLRRVVRIPKDWQRIVEVAKRFGYKLPSQPDSKSLDAFLMSRKEADPESFADLSLTVIKLLGRGEYIVENSQGASVGHFALALANYTHFTAPNRRFPDLISQRQYKAFLNHKALPYSLEELQQLAAHCTAQEDAAMKVERQTNKSAAAALLSTQIGSLFQGIITGANDKGTWARIFQPPVEGKVVRGFDGLDVGDRVRVRLDSVNIAKGFINFTAV